LIEVLRLLNFVNLELRVSRPLNYLNVLKRFDVIINNLFLEPLDIALVARVRAISDFRGTDFGTSIIEL
jgi:hypothetical protein